MNQKITIKVEVEVEVEEIKIWFYKCKNKSYKANLIKKKFKINKLKK